MKSENKLLQIVAIGLVAIAVLFAAKLLFVGDSLQDTKTIQSQGTAEMISSPDQAEIYARIEVLKKTAEEAAEESKVKSDAVVTALKALEGVTVETTGYNIYKQEDWTQNGPVFKGYTATYSLKVTTTDFDLVGKTIDAAVQNGANMIDSVQFTLSKDAEEKVRGEALKRASENAKMKATSVAEGLGVELGDIVGVSESNFYAQPYYYAKAAEMVSSGRPAADLVIEPSSITVSASINVVYEIDD